MPCNTRTLVLFRPLLEPSSDVVLRYIENWEGMAE